jgi:hypothetical protein
VSKPTDSKAEPAVGGSGQHIPEAALALAAADAAKAAAQRQREHLWSLADLVAQSAEDLDLLLEAQGFELRCSDRNGLLHFDSAGAEEEPPKPAPLLQGLHTVWRNRPSSDSREPPNLYLELMPLRLHCALRLAGLRMMLGDFAATDALLREAEARMTFCVYLFPWLYVEFCAMKLQWRRLKREVKIAEAHALPPKSSLAVKWLNPLVFANGACPQTDSALFRTFVRRAQAPSLMADTAWVVEHVPPSGEQGDQHLRDYLRELLSVVRVAMQEGGHDYGQLFRLLREGLEEVLWVKGLSPEASQDFALLFALFSNLVSVAESCKALQFEKPELPQQGGAESLGASKAGKADPKAAAAKGGGGADMSGKVDSEKLPRRVALDLQRHLKRQGAAEGALAYSLQAQQEAQKQLPFRAVLRHALALKRECNIFENVYHSERLLSDQLHVKLSKASEVYAKVKILPEEALKEIDEPNAPPSAGDVLIHWMRTDVQDSLQPASDCCSFLVFLCPLGEEAPAIVARCRDVQVAGLRKLLDGLWRDLGHCKPASAVTAAFFGQRLRDLARTLRGKAKGEVLAGSDARLDKALAEFLRELEVPNGDGGAPAPAGAQDAEAAAVTSELLDSQKVQGVLLAVTRLLDRGLFAARVAHPGLSRFLRVAVRPLSIFPA